MCRNDRLRTNKLKRAHGVLASRNCLEYSAILKCFISVPVAFEHWVSFAALTDCTDVILRNKVFPEAPAVRAVEAPLANYRPSDEQRPHVAYTSILNRKL